METVFRDYADKGVQFFYVYKALAHPEWDGYVRPYTLEERLQHIQAAKERLGTGIPWIADTMQNDIKHVFGNRPNSEFLFDPDGNLVTARTWSDPEALRSDLADRLGAVEPRTTMEDLNLPERRALDRPAASGIVPRLNVQGRWQANLVAPQEASEPFYVKLRSEMDANLVDTGKGQMLLGFHLDPLYGVHWNNLVDPIEWEIVAPEGISVQPAKGKGPKVDAPSDVDPREFLVEIDRGGKEDSLELVVRYFGCNDEEGWCKAITQKYVLRFEPDPDAGRPMQGGRRRGGFGPQSGQGRFAPGRRGGFGGRRDFIRPR